MKLKELLDQKPVTCQSPTREELIYLWKTEGGNYSWAKWAAMHGIPAHNPGFIESLKEEAKEGKVEE